MFNPSIILVSPQMGVNIGAAARVMLNFGLTDLRLVAPRDGWPNEEADRNSAGALDKMPPVQVFETLSEAIADLHYVLATTARPRDLVKPVFEPDQACSELVERSIQDQKCGIVFGGERAGLTTEDVAFCQGIVTYPTNPDFSSLNLAQAVLLMCWSVFQAVKNRECGVAVAEKELPANQEELDGFIQRLDVALDAAEFYKSEGLKPTMQRNIRSIFTRGDLTAQEVRTLHGILTALVQKA